MNNESATRAATPWRNIRSSASQCGGTSSGGAVDVDLCACAALRHVPQFPAPSKANPVDRKGSGRASNAPQAYKPFAKLVDIVFLSCMCFSIRRCSPTPGNAFGARHPLSLRSCRPSDPICEKQGCFSIKAATSPPIPLLLTRATKNKLTVFNRTSARRGDTHCLRAECTVCKICKAGKR